jgi:GNAT superfamily N-acetyltransferase
MTRYAYPYGAFCVEQIPNQPQVAHCHSFFVFDSQRGRGLGKALKAKQCEMLRELGYDFAQCTTAGNNARQHRVLESCGWFRMSEFPNKQSGGTTVLWGWCVNTGEPTSKANQHPEWEAA